MEGVVCEDITCLQRYLDPYDWRMSIEVYREPGNVHDRRAVCIKKGGAIVGHVPRELTAILVKFIDHGGTISCMQGARETTTRKRIRNSLLLYIIRKEEKHLKHTCVCPQKCIMQ